MPTASVRWVADEQFLAMTPSGHAVPFDSDRGKNSAPGPMEMLLAALGSCTATDVVSILKKKRQPLESLEVQVSGERADSPPRVWTKIEVVYRLRGALDEKAVKDAIELSQSKYCSVSVMLGRTAAIGYRYELLEPAVSPD
jgi:putative redox protein